MNTFFLTTSLLAHASPGASLFVSPPSPGRCIHQSHVFSTVHQTKAHIHPTLLQMSYETANDLSALPLPQLLELLHQNNVRYAPNASREELEDLLQLHLRSMPSGDRSRNRARSRRTTRSNSSKNQRSNDVVDVDVVPVDLDDRRTYQYAKGQEQFTDGSRNKRSRSRRRSDGRYYRDKRDHARKYRGRQQRSNQYTDDNIIDAVFDLPDEMPEDSTYNNGLQIFLMGFIEAGKTAAELAVDAAKNVISAPFSDDTWYNEELGRDVVDVRVGDYRRGYWYDERDTLPRRRSRRRKKVYNKGKTSQASSERSQQSNATPIKTRQRSPRSRDPTTDTATSKPVYGLEYVHEDDIRKNEGSEPPIYRQLHNQKRKWKDRLRTKFDAALGLESTTAQEEKESYYDSWKRNMRDLDNSRKDRLRRKMNEENSAAPTQEQTATDSNRVPQNRRARMRAMRAGILVESNPSQSTQISTISHRHTKPIIKSYRSKLRPEEEPIWRERGSIASLLFDGSPSSWRKNMQRKNKNTLEVRQLICEHVVSNKPPVTFHPTNNAVLIKKLLLSPAGRERTITSLMVYITRSSFSIFGNLCRWAGVRGTIPQPIVVVIVSAVILSSYRQQKMLSLGLTLLAIRMIGEFVHGASHGNEFWDDEYDKENHEWVTND